MKAIILQTEQDFETLQNRIHLSLQENIQGYNGERWANPIINVTTNEYACVIETEGLRGAIILGFVLTNEEKLAIIDLDSNDENYFPKSDILGGRI